MDLVVDGGNIVRLGWKAIMTERVYQENPGFRKPAVHAILMDLLNVDKLIMIPVEPGDPYGHADGCVRFVDENTVLINEPLAETSRFCRELRKILEKNSLRWHEMPYFWDYDPKNKDSAVGNYLNYLEVANLIVVLRYRGYNAKNKKAILVLRQVFGSSIDIVSVEATPIAKQGGVLNCVSWNIFS